MIELLVQDMCVMMNVNYTRKNMFEKPKKEDNSNFKFKIKNINFSKKEDNQEQMTIDDIIFGN
ncbi:hypothetical protein [Staphylococcus shinii]|uniref:hypothetical protein n=1 Tax=Staphylococcus shinii TaxID=2912228 RepID=UPI003F5546FE